MKFVQNLYDMRDFFLDGNVPFEWEHLAKQVYVPVFKMPIGIYKIIFNIMCHFYRSCSL